MKRIHIPLTILLVTIWIFARGTAYGQELYLGLEIGRNSHSGMNITGSSNDRASVCDEYINPMYATVTQTAGYENYNCTGSNRGAGDNWSNSFDGARGILSGFVLGYRAWENDLAGMRVRLRPEFEYSYQVSQYNQTSEIPFAEGASGDKLRQEIWVANDRIGTLTGHNLFGNLYLDFINSYPGHPLCRVWHGCRSCPDGILRSVGQERRPHRDLHRRGVAQRRRDPPESCWNDQCRPRGTFRHSVRLSGAVRSGLRNDGICVSRGEGPLGQLLILP